MQFLLDIIKNYRLGAKTNSIIRRIILSNSSYKKNELHSHLKRTSPHLF